MREQLPEPTPNTQALLDLDCGVWGRHQVTFRAHYNRRRRGAAWFWVAVYGERLGD